MATAKHRAIIIFCFVITVITSCSSNTKIVLDANELERRSISDFVLPEGDSGTFSVQEKHKRYEISNLLSSGYNEDGIFYAYLSNKTEAPQLLLVIDRKRDIYKWTDFYPDTSHLYTKNMVAFVIYPFPERHQEEKIVVTDFLHDKTIETVNSSKRSSGDDILQELYYMQPSFSETEAGLELNIFWKQAHYPMTKMRYSLDGLRIGFSSNDDGYSINELTENPNQFDQSQAPLLDTHSVVCSQRINDSIVAIAVHPSGSTDWNDYVIAVSKGQEKAVITKLAPLFRYQDPLVSIRSAVPVDHRAAFIIETAEFVYDFYYDPATGESDAFLRPSSFTTRYPH